MDTSASATTTSIIVKPLSPLRLDDILRDNFHASRQPIHPHFEPTSEPRQSYRAAAGHAAGEKRDGRKRPPTPAALRQKRVEYNVVWNLDETGARARSDASPLRVDHGLNRSASPERSVAIGLEQSSNFDRVGFQLRPRRRHRQSRQRDGGEQRHYRKDADHLQQGETRFRALVVISR
jgi:hypothetical protein